MSRIKCTRVNYGDNFVLPIEKTEEEKADSPEKIKLKEELLQLENQIEEVKQKHQEIIAEAQTQSESLLEKTNKEILLLKEETAKQLEAEALKTKEEAYKAGYDDGYKQGYETITGELEDKVRAVEIFSESQFALKTNIIKSAELDIVQLVIEIANKVCTKSLELNPELLKALTLKAIKALKDKEEIKIIVNPKLTEVINTISDEIQAELPQLKTIRIIEDSNISPDGTIVESLLTRVDSRVKAQINEIADKLMAGYNAEDSNDNQQPEETIFMEDFSKIELSDEANILDFLEELEEIPLLSDKKNDEETKYYEKVYLEELKNPKSQSDETKSIDDINIDMYDDYGIEDLEKSLNEPTQETLDSIEDFNETDLTDSDLLESIDDTDLSEIENINIEDIEETQEPEMIQQPDLDTIEDIETLEEPKENDI